MKKIIFIIVSLYIISSSLFSGETKKDYLLQADNKEGGANIAWIDCYATYCEIICIGGGTVDCSFTNPEIPCNDCGLFFRGLGQFMMNYAQDQISNDNYSGSYNNNFINEVGTYYRTVSWIYNTQSNSREISLTITEVTQ